MKLRVGFAARTWLCVVTPVGVGLAQARTPAQVADDMLAGLEYRTGVPAYSETVSQSAGKGIGELDAVALGFLNANDRRTEAWAQQWHAELQRLGISSGGMKGVMAIKAMPRVPGALAYGRTQEEAMALAEALALGVVADRLEYGEIAGDLG